MKPYKKPAQAKDLREAGRVILAHGEVTGHCHEVVADARDIDAEIPAADFFEEPDGRRVLVVTRRTELTHQEHSSEFRTFLSPDGTVEKHTIATGLVETRPYPAQCRQGDVFLNPIAPGVWEHAPQREHAPEAIRNVAD